MPVTKLIFEVLFSIKRNCIPCYPIKTTMTCALTYSFLFNSNQPNTIEDYSTYSLSIYNYSLM